MGTGVAEKPVKQYESMDDLMRNIKGNTELVDEYAELVKDKGTEEGEKEFFAKHVKAKEENKDEEAKKLAEEAEAKRIDEEKDKNGGEQETPEEKEAREKAEKEEKDKAKEKSAGETDGKTRLTELEQQIENMRGANARQYEDLQQKLRDAESARRAADEQLEAIRLKSEKALKEPLPEEIKLDDLGDLLEEEGQKKLLGKLQVLVDDRKKNHELILTLQAAVVQAQTDAKRALETSTERTDEKSELATIEELRRENPQLFSKRPITEIENDFHDFMADLGDLIGFKGVVEKDGIWAKEIQDAYRLYHDEAKGKELRAKADAAKVKLPDDFDDLTLVHKLKRIREENLSVQYDEKGNKSTVPWEYRKALEYLGNQSRKQPDKKLDDARDKREREERAAKNRERFAREISPDKGGNLADVSKVSTEEFQRKLRSYLGAVEEPPMEDRQWLESVMTIQGLEATEIARILNDVKRKPQKRKKE